MVRLAGAVLAAGACGWLGFYKAAAMKKKIVYLQGMESDFTLLSQELETGFSLPRILGKLAPRCAGPAAELFRFCARELASDEREGVARVWQRGIDGLTELSREERALLIPLGNTLGQCGIEEQRAALERLRYRLSLLRQRAEEDYRSQGRVYRTLGISGGTFLVILLL